MTEGKIKVLVVDDDEFVRLNLLAYLEDEGFSVFSATSGEEALGLLDHQEVDVAAVDMRLPGMDGNTFILKAHQARPGTRFVVYTGSINYNLPESLKAVGVRTEHVFLKPVEDMEILRRAIEAAARDRKP
ncbi:MAG: response regulator [Thermodesulfobacteriota bacterium]